MLTISGHHHISMITKSAQQNVHFYRDQLGLRLVKKTVNQDDPTMYHLFYGDAKGNPGTSLTFFEMPYVGRTYRGTNAITKIGLLVEDKEALLYWKNRFDQLEIEHDDLIFYDGRFVLPFEDPDGLKLFLIDNSGNKIPSFWKKWQGSAVPLKQQILGIGPVELTVRRPKKLGKLLVELFHYEQINTSNTQTIYRSQLENSYSEIIVKHLESASEKPGRGSVHHLALRVPDEAAMHQWSKLITERGYESTGVINRHYFYSLYFRESNGIMFELATDGPGLHIDEPIDRLGESLILPPFLEEKRPEIETTLKPIT